MRTRRLTALFGVVLILVVLAIMAAPNVVSAGPKTLKVGAIANLTWPLGIHMKKFFDSYIPALNEKGGLEIGGEKYQIKIILYDSKGSNETGRAAAERLIHRVKVKFILGDETVEAWVPVTEENKVMTVSTTPTPVMFNPKYKYCFQSSVLQTQAVVLWGWFAKNFPEVKTFMTAYPDSAAGQAENKHAERCAEIFGLKKLAPIFYMPNTTDFSAIATKVKRSAPDMFSTAAGGPVQDSLLIKALHEAGYKGKLFTQTTIPLAEIAKVIPLDMAEGMISAVCGIHLDPIPSPYGQFFKEAYIAKYGEWDEPDSLFCDGWRMLAAGLAKAQSTDPVKVAETISNGMKFVTLGGEAVMVARPDMGVTRKCDVLNKAYIREVVTGEAKLIATVDIDTGYGYCKKFFGWK